VNIVQINERPGIIYSVWILAAEHERPRQVMRGCWVYAPSGAPYTDARPILSALAISLALMPSPLAARTIIRGRPILGVGAQGREESRTVLDFLREGGSQASWKGLDRADPA
jgi:hypothetical protein